MHKYPHMHRKLSALGVAVAVVAVAPLSSCNDNDPGTAEPREIGISTSDGLTRVTGSPLDTDYKMWVTTLYHEKQNKIHRYYLNDALFEGKTVGTQNIWTAPGGLYYPLSGTMDFVACASRNGKHKPAASYYTSAPLPSVSDTEPYFKMINLDYRSSGLDGTDDVLVSTVYPGAPCGKEAKSAVPLEFKHLLSNVKFRFIASSEEAATCMKITGLELRNVRLSGVANLTREKGEPWTVSWPASSLTSLINVRRNTDFFPVYKSTDYKDVDFYVAPQDVVNNATFSVYYKYCYNGSETHEMLYVLNSQLGSKVKRFETGRRYLYNVYCLLLPHLEFNISLVDGESGIIIDEWTVEPEINI